MNCPECNEVDFYQPLMKKGECKNSKCSLYSEYHAEKCGKTKDLSKVVQKHTMWKSEIVKFEPIDVSKLKDLFFDTYKMLKLAPHSNFPVTYKQSFFRDVNLHQKMSYNPCVEIDVPITARSSYDFKIQSGSSDIFIVKNRKDKK